MANPYSDQALVLHRRPSGEVDRIVTMLTRGHGLQTVIARGVRKPQARNAAGIELYNHSLVELMPGRGFTVLIRAVSQSDYWPAEDLVRTSCFSMIGEAGEAVTQNDVSDPGVFDAVLAARDSIVASSEDPRVTLMYAMRNLVGRAGYFPELHTCGECQKPVLGERRWFVPQLGSVLHDACRSPEHIAMRCVSATCDALESDGDSWSLDPRPSVEAALAGVRLLTSHLGYQVDHRFRSMALLQQLASSQVLEKSGAREVDL